MVSKYINAYYDITDKAIKMRSKLKDISSSYYELYDEILFGSRTSDISHIKNVNKTIIGMVNDGLIKSYEGYGHKKALKELVDSLKKSHIRNKDFYIDMFSDYYRFATGETKLISEKRLDTYIKDAIKYLSKSYDFVMQKTLKERDRLEKNVAYVLELLSSAVTKSDKLIAFDTYISLIHQTGRVLMTRFAIISQPFVYSRLSRFFNALEEGIA